MAIAKASFLNMRGAGCTALRPAGTKTGQRSTRSSAATGAVAAATARGRNARNRGGRNEREGSRRPRRSTPSPWRTSGTWQRRAVRGPAGRCGHRLKEKEGERQAGGRPQRDEDDEEGNEKPPLRVGTTLSETTAEQGHCGQATRAAAGQEGASAGQRKREREREREKEHKQRRKKTTTATAISNVSLVPLSFSPALFVWVGAEAFGRVPWSSLAQDAGRGVTAAGSRVGWSGRGESGGRAKTVCRLTAASGRACARSDHQ